jgi:hypothetical protein
MLKFICDLSFRPDITAHRLYQAGIQRNGGDLPVDLHGVHVSSTIGFPPSSDTAIVP